MSNPFSLLQIIGYVGSALVLLSLMMSNIYRLRVINLMGASVACFFAVMTKSYPFMVMNGCIAVIDIYYLIQMHRREDMFSTLQIYNRQSSFLNRFMEFYRDRDNTAYPQEFDLDLVDDPQIFFILRNLIPVGLLIYTEEPYKVIRIHMDYISPDYRDMKNAKFLYRDALRSKLRERGFTTIEASPYNKSFEKYLQKVGFKKEEKGHYRKPL